MRSRWSHRRAVAASTRQRCRGQFSLLLVILISMGLLAGLLGAGSHGGFSSSRQQARFSSMLKARGAVMSAATINAGHPGALPCPDADNDGLSDVDGVTGFCVSYIGRIPYKSLSLDAWTDSDGETLWYALSANFDDVIGHVINSDTPGQLNVQG